MLKDLKIGVCFKDFPSNKMYKQLFKILKLKMFTHVRIGFMMTKY